MSDTDVNVSELARQVVDEIDPGTTIGDKVILSRRQLIAIAGGGLSMGALATFGVTEAEAQEAEAEESAGVLGTEDDLIDVFAGPGGNVLREGDVETVQSESIAGGYQITIGTDEYQLLEE